MASDGEKQESLLTLRRQRRMTRVHGALWALILSSTVADILLTLVGTAGGLQEANAAVGVMMDAFGPAGLWFVKFLAMVWLVGGWAFLSDRNAAIFLALFATVTVLVTVYNALLLVNTGVIGLS
jgi:hypothetical protein